LYDESKEVYINIYDKNSDKIAIKPLEEMVKQLVAWSMPLSFHIEALKCQSIIMRTRVVRQMTSYQNRGVGKQKEADVLMESFVGAIPLEEYKDIWNDNYDDYVKKLEIAVSETKNMVLLFNNKPIDARVNLVCGGSTENSENVEGNVVQYLRKVLCNHCGNSPYALNYKDITIEEVENKLGINLTNDEILKDTHIDNMIGDVIRDEQDRVTKMKIGGKEFRGKEIMDILDINSTRFGWRPQMIRFFTVGKGDGLGLCQYGANNMACGGGLVNEILKYYYTGVEIKKMQNPCINMPLKGKLIVIDPAHGGIDSDDHVGSQGLREKDVNLSIALYLEAELKSLGAEVYLTRREDKVVHLNDRALMVNDISPHFFISIHQNYFNHPSKSGTEIYYFRGDEIAKELAKEIMLTLTEELKTLDRGIKPADFSMLRQVMVSSIHLEVAYISNPSDEKMLMDENARKRAAKSIAKGFINFYRYI